jgi:hypothetical protein
MESNPYSAPQTNTAGNGNRPGYDAFDLWRKVSRRFRRVVFLFYILAALAALVLSLG